MLCCDRVSHGPGWALSKTCDVIEDGYELLLSLPPPLKSNLGQFTLCWRLKPGHCTRQAITPLLSYAPRPCVFWLYYYAIVTWPRQGSEGDSTAHLSPVSSDSGHTRHSTADENHCLHTPLPVANVPLVGFQSCCTGGLAYSRADFIIMNHTYLNSSCRPGRPQVLQFRCQCTEWVAHHSSPPHTHTP